MLWDNVNTSHIRTLYCPFPAITSPSDVLCYSVGLQTTAIVGAWHT